MKKNYIIPCQKRVAKIMPQGNTEVTLRTVDGVGMYIHHPKDNIPTDKDIRNTLIGLENFGYLIKANSWEEALKEFYDIGGAKEGLKEKALTLNDSETNPIIEYVGCKYMGNKLNCGVNCEYFDDEHTPKDSFMFCILNGLDDVHDDCPIHKQINEERKEIKQIGGVWLQTYHKLCEPTQGIKIENFKTTTYET